MGTETRYYIYADDFTAKGVKSAENNFRRLTGTITSFNRTVKAGAVLLAGGALVAGMRRFDQAIQDTAADAKRFDSILNDLTRNQVIELAKASSNLTNDWKLLRVTGTALLSEVFTPLAKLSRMVINGMMWRKPVEDYATAADLAAARSKQLASELASIDTEARKIAESFKRMRMDLLAAGLASINAEAEEIGKWYQESVTAARGFNAALEKQEQIFRRFNPAEMWGIGDQPNAGPIAQVKALKPALDDSVEKFAELTRQVGIFVDEFSFGAGAAIANFVTGNQTAAEAFKSIWRNAIAAVVADFTANLVRRGLLGFLASFGPGGAAIAGLLGHSAGKGGPVTGSLSSAGKAGGGTTTYIATVVPPSVTSLLSAGYVLDRSAAQRARFAVA